MSRRRRNKKRSLLFSSITSFITTLTILLLALYIYSHLFQDKQIANKQHKKEEHKQLVVSNSKPPLDQPQERKIIEKENNNKEDTKEASHPIQPNEKAENIDKEENIPKVCPPYVNKDSRTVLSENYIPKNLKRVSSPNAMEIKKRGATNITEEANQILIEETMLIAEAANALDSLITAAKKDGIELYAYSGYRSYKTQEKVFQRNVDKLGKKQAERVSAIPGHSEHQTGLAMDITSKALIDIYKEDKTISALQQNFGTQLEGKWLQQNAYKFGFTMSYPEGKEEITGYDYEPWHFYYVGKTVAKFLYQTNQLFAEYATQNCL